MRVPRSTRLAFPLMMLAAVAACGDSTAPSPTLRAPAAPTAIISDGSRVGGNPDFFFLPPVVADPASDPDFSPGEFNGSWKPVVEVCEVDASNLSAGCVGAIVRAYSGAGVTVSGEEYSAHIDTKEPWAIAGKTYRFTVSVVGTQPVTLGFVDIALLAGSAKNVITGDLVALQDGRTIPLKFRIEKGATVPAGIDVFSETAITDAGATVLTGGTGAPGTFALRFPTDWLPPELDQVVIVVEKLSTGPGGGCLTSVPNLLQTSDCWRVTSYPEIPRVTQDLTVAFCPALAESDPRYDAQAIFKFDAPSRLEELESVPTTLVNCNPSGEIGAAPRQPGMLGALQYGLASLGRGLAKTFGPNTAHAVDLGWGGRLVASDEDVEGGVFSEFFWGIPLRLEVLGGNGQSGEQGAPLAAPLSVRVVGTHLHHDEAIAIPGVTVRFFASAGTLGGATAVTNADGVATMPWTLGASAGAQSVFATITSIGVDTAVTFTATAHSPLFILVDGNDVSGTTQIVTTDFEGTISAAGGSLTTGCSLVTSDPTVINLDPPVIIANNPGTAVVTATCGAATATTTYVVNPIVSIRLRDNGTEFVGTTTTVTTSFSAGMVVSTIPTTDVACTLSSSDPRVMEVYPSPPFWVIRPLTAGTVVLTATCGAVTGTATFNVVLPGITSITVGYGGDRYVSGDNVVRVDVGRSETFVATPYSGQTAVPAQACTFGLDAVGDDAFVSQGTVTSNSIVVNGVRDSGQGYSLLEITCGAATRSIRIYVGGPPIG